MGRIHLNGCPKFGVHFCPPEDVGGLSGYFEFLEAVTNPLHEEHDAMVEWCGGNFDPTHFDVTETNLRLQHIKF